MFGQSEIDGVALKKINSKYFPSVIWTASVHQSKTKTLRRPKILARLMSSASNLTNLVYSTQPTVYNTHFRGPMDRCGISPTLPTLVALRSQPDEDEHVEAGSYQSMWTPELAAGSDISDLSPQPMDGNGDAVMVTPLSLENLGHVSTSVFPRRQLDAFNDTSNQCSCWLIETTILELSRLFIHEDAFGKSHG